MTTYMLTTSDNPFNPFTEFDDWKREDEALGYYSSELIARVVRTSDELSKADEEFAIQIAIEDIVNENISGKHIKVPHP